MPRAVGFVGRVARRGLAHVRQGFGQPAMGPTRAEQAFEDLHLAREEAESTAARLRTVADVAGGVIRADSLPALHAVLRDVCGQLFTFDRFAVVAGEPVGPPGTPVPLRALGDSDPSLAAVVVGGITVAGCGTARPDSFSTSASSVLAASDCSTLVRPVLGDDAVLGYIALGADRPDAFRVSDGEVLEALAALAATAIRNLVLVGELRYSREAYAHQALHDPLTGLPNRAGLHEHLARVLGGPHPERVSVLVLDLDGFKRVNDSLGHPQGDSLLVQVAERLLDATRGSDTVARLGGDEFAVLLENTRAPDDAVAVAERVLGALRAPFDLGGAEAMVGTSVGIAFSGAAEADLLGDATALGDALLRDADLAMYRAKESGKGRYVVYEPHMHAEAVSRLEREADLRAAIEKREFRLYYQPIVALETGAALGVEALVRWEHPLRGLVPPAEFIPLAEETGLIVPLGRWVLGEACRQARVWADHAWGTDLTVTVNVSGIQLYDAAFVEDVRLALAASGVTPQRLVLELTETVMVDRPGLALERFNALKALGVRLAIDDFGTGYSALSYLRQFPFDVLKIDKSFVDEVATRGQAATLAAAIVALGNAFALRTVAEGVESADQATALGEIGCAIAQGYHFSRPLAAEAVTAWLAAERVAPAPDPLGGVTETRWAREPAGGRAAPLRTVATRGELP